MSDEKTKRVTVYMTEDQYAELKKIADSYASKIGVSVPKYLLIKGLEASDG